MAEQLFAAARLAGSNLINAVLMAAAIQRFGALRALPAPQAFRLRARDDRRGPFASRRKLRTPSARECQGSRPSLRRASSRSFSRARGLLRDRSLDSFRHRLFLLQLRCAEAAQ